MTIIPSTSQEVTKYTDGENTGASNLFINYTRSYNCVYRIIDNIRYGIDLIEADFSFTWDVLGQTLTVETTDTEFDLQGSAIQLNPFQDTLNKCIIVIGLDDNQPAELNKAVYRYTIDGNVASWQALIFIILERKGQIKSNPADPREMGLEKISLVNCNLVTSATGGFGTGGGNNYATVSVSGSISVAGTTLASMIPTFSNTFGDSESNTSGNPPILARSHVSRVVSVSGNDAIFDDKFFYRNIFIRFGNDASTGLPQQASSTALQFSGRQSGSNTIYDAIAGLNSNFKTTIPATERLFSNKNNSCFELGLVASAIGDRLATTVISNSPAYIITRISSPNIVQMNIERFLNMEDNPLPQCSKMYARWSSDQRDYFGMSQAEVDLLPKIFFGRLGVIGRTNSSQGGDAGDGYMDYSQAEVIADYGGTETLGCTIDSFNFNASQAISATITVDPALITDKTKCKNNSQGLNGLSFGTINVTATGFTIRMFGTISVLKPQNSTALTTTYEVVSRFKQTVQQYDDDGNLLPY